MSLELSVVIPVYNAEKYVASCMDSILQQTDIDLEIIVIDDCSTDQSLTILRQYENDKRVTVLALDKNGGQGNARNRGLLEARGTFVLFVDSDDYLTEQKTVLCDLVRQMKEEQLDIVDCSYFQVEQHRREKKNVQVSKIERGGKYLDTVEVLSVVVWNKIYRKQFLIENQLFFKKRKYEDVNFVVESYLIANRVNTSNTPFYNYIIRENSTMTSAPKKHNVEDVIALVKDLEISYKENKTIFQVEKTFFYSFIGAARIISKYKGDTQDIQECLSEYKQIFKKYRSEISKSRAINKVVRMSLFLSPFLANRILLMLKK